MKSPVAGVKPTLSGAANLARFPHEMSDFRVTESDGIQRETSATIKGPPNPYIQASPPVSHNIIEIDCRGLEFTDFKADVSLLGALDKQEH